MSYRTETPFDSIEGSLEYVELLAETVAEAQRDVEVQHSMAEGAGAERRKQALALVSYKLESLNRHMVASRRLLNDLRTLRRLLLEERAAATSKS